MDEKLAADAEKCGVSAEKLGGALEKVARGREFLAGKTDCKPLKSYMKKLNTGF